MPQRERCSSPTFTDWRLPNVRELQSLVHFRVIDPAVPNTVGTGQWVEGDPFSDVQSAHYWASTTFVASTRSAWLVTMEHGTSTLGGKDLLARLWPVRGGQ